MKTIIVIRHAPIVEAEGLCYGRTDWAMSAEAALEQARPLFNELDPLPLLCSPLLRCQALATQLASLMARPLRIEPRLIEMDFGEWEGRAWRDLPRAQLDQWRSNIGALAPPGGESFDALLARVESLLAVTAGNQIWITHAGVVRALKMLLQGESLVQAIRSPVPHLSPMMFVTG